jgi:hypothetical protein
MSYTMSDTISYTTYTAEYIYIIMYNINIYSVPLSRPGAKFLVVPGGNPEQEVLGALRSERACQSHTSLEGRP